MLSQKDFDAILASEGQWFNKGSELFELSNSIPRGVERSNLGTRLFVGRVVAARVRSNSVYEHWHRILAAEMLYSFAVENWLKGILIARYKRSSPEMHQEISTLLRKTIDQTLPNEEYVGAILEALETPVFADKLSELDITMAQENEQRRFEALRYKRHNLLELAKVTGVRKLIGLKECLYLAGLSQAIYLGRYPALSTPKKVRNLERLFRRPELKEHLNDAIATRYKSVKRL